MVTECEIIGIGGGCGTTCDVWLRGECALAEEGMEHYSLEERVMYFEIYGAEYD